MRIKDFKIIFLTFIVFSFQLYGQTLIFYKPGEKEVWIAKTAPITLKTIDGVKYFGRADTIIDNSVILKTKDGETISVDNSKIKTISRRRPIWALSPTIASIIKYNKKYNVLGFKCKYKPRKT